eukprot:gene13674-biopygen8044
MPTHPPPVGHRAVVVRHVLRRGVHHVSAAPPAARGLGPDTARSEAGMAPMFLVR